MLAGAWHDTRAQSLDQRITFLGTNHRVHTTSSELG
jgi:hypothetical protein